MAVASYFIHCNVSSFSLTNKRRIWQEDGGNVIVKIDQLCAYKDIRRFFKKVIFGVVFSVIFYFILDFKYLLNIQIIDIYLKKTSTKIWFQVYPHRILKFVKETLFDTCSCFCFWLETLPSEDPPSWTSTWVDTDSENKLECFCPQLLSIETYVEMKI